MSVTQLLTSHMHPHQGAEEISMKHRKKMGSSLMMWKVWCGLQELTEATGKIHHLQLCVQFWFWSAVAWAHAPRVFQTHWYMTQIFPFSFVSETLSTVWKISRSKESSANSKTMPQVGKHLRQEWAAKHQLLDSFEYFVSYFYICMCCKACLSVFCLPNESPKPPVPQLWFISERTHERQIACFQITHLSDITGHFIIWRKCFPTCLNLPFPLIHVKPLPLYADHSEITNHFK